jgi:AcrR family transcriptional regulator
MNNSTQLVRKLRPKAGSPAERDRRVRRTQHALTFALVDLALEKRYDAITIQDLLDRADVGRSTFYSHYRGKDDLLLRSFERMLDMLDGALDSEDGSKGRLAPVRELFAHIGEFRQFQLALARAHVMERQFQVGVEHISRTIERRLPANSRVPREVMARSLAGSLFSLLRWWIDNDTPYTPEQMDRMFHALRPAP